MFTVLTERAELIVRHTPPGMEYYGGILADATIRSALFSETVDRCTLSDIYRARREPEIVEEADVFSVENTSAFFEIVSTSACRVIA